MTLAVHSVSPAFIGSALLAAIAETLANERVRYCQWKGHYRQDRWMNGNGDIDLLVAPESLPRLLEVLHLAGFVQTTSSDHHKLLGTAHYRALDTESRRILHVHVHTRLLIEAARGLVYRLPFEEPLISSSRPGPLFRVPTPDLEALVLVLRTTLRWASWRRVPQATREELAYLEGLEDPRYQLELLRRHLRCVAPEVYRRCREALNPGASSWDRWTARSHLTRALRAYARRPTLGERVLHAAAAAAWHLRGGPRRDNGARLTNGGRLLALAGTDGSGKSTCVAVLNTWLEPHIQVMTAHVGRPPRSLLTLVVGALRKLMPWRVLFWARLMCTARDRYRLVTRAWHFALQGGITLAERYPMAPNQALVGPWIRHTVGEPMPRTARWLAELEEDYYARMPRPDRVFVLDVDPDVAVRRKTDEPSGYVRSRAEMSRRIDWTGTAVCHVDAGRPLKAVIGDLQELIWKAL